MKKPKFELKDYTLLRAKFRASLLADVAPFAAKMDIRYYLCGFRVEAAGDRPGVYILGCDGHRLMIAYDSQGMIENDDGQGIILANHPGFVSACAKKTKGGIPQQVLITGRRVSVAPDWGSLGRGGETFVMPGDPFVDGKYPDWRRVLPDFSKLKPGMANAVQSGFLADYAKPVRGDRWRGIRFWQEINDAPIVVQLASRPELVGILMPLRDTYEPEYGLKELQAVVETRREAA